MRLAGLPPEEETWSWAKRLAARGPRLTGSPAHREHVDWLAAGFRDAGLDVARDAFALDRWSARRWAIEAHRPGAAAVEIPVASCYPGSGRTGPEGVRGPLVHVGGVRDARIDAGRVRGRIVLADMALERVPFASGKLWGVHDPAGEGAPEAWHTASMQWVALETLRAAAAQAGALGMIVGWTNISEENALGQYQPIVPPSVQSLNREWTGGAGETTADATRPALPALWVGPAARSALLGLPETAGVRLRLEADLQPAVPTDTLVATLPGASRESIVVITHTDGVSACQENGTLAMLALARCFAALPAAARRRTLVFSASTAHFVSEVNDPATGRRAVAETEGVLQRHPELLRDTVAAIGLEHLGMMEWVDDGGRHYPSGRPEWGHCITSSAALAGVMLESFAPARLCPVVAVDAPMWGLPRPMSEAGVPTVGYGVVSSYVMSTAPDGHLGKLSPRRLHEEIASFARAVARLDELPASRLKA